MVHNMLSVVDMELIDIYNYTYPWNPPNLIKGVEKLLEGYGGTRPHDQTHTQIFEMYWSNATACDAWGKVRICAFLPNRVYYDDEIQMRLPAAYREARYPWGSCGVYGCDVMNGMKYYVAIMSEKRLPDGTKITARNSTPEYTHTEVKPMYTDFYGKIKVFEIESKMVAENPDDTYEYVYDVDITIPI